MNISLLLKTNTSCDYHRLLIPFKYYILNNGDKLNIFRTGHRFTHSDFEKIDVLIVNRLPAGISHHTLIEARKEYGFKIVVDIDDYWDLYEEHHQYRAHVDRNESGRLRDFLSKADMIWTTNDRLTMEASQISPNAYTIPNGLPFGYEQFVQGIPNEEDKFRLLYAGGISHLYDMKSIRNLLKKLGDDTNYRQNSTFVLAGYNRNLAFGDNSEWALIEREISSIKNYELKSVLPINKYMEAYDGVDACIAPLMNNKFNSLKSNLKIIEAGCKCLPIVCSSMYPFRQDESQNGKGLFLCNTPKEWYLAIKRLKRDRDFCREMGQQLRKYVVDNYDLFKINELRKNTLELLIKGVI